MLLQFTTHSKFDVKFLRATRYRFINFKLQDFLRYVHPISDSTNYYQVKKILNSVQSDVFIAYFAHDEFSRLATIPKIVIKKSKDGNWVVNIWLLEKLFYYQYPFVLPNFSNLALKNHEFPARLWFLKVFSSVNIDKIFLVDAFLNSYPSVLSNRQKTLIKLVGFLRRLNLIEPRCRLLVGYSNLSASKLTPSNIHKGFIIYENFIFYFLSTLKVFQD